MSMFTVAALDRVARGVASVAICWMGYAVMDLTSGKTGIGWAAMCLFIVWAASGIETRDGDRKEDAS